MYKLLTEIPVPSSAHFIDANAIHVTSTLHDHVRNVKRITSNSLVVTESSVTTSPLQDVGDELAFAYSPSRSRRAVLREINKTKRFVEIWQKNTLEASIEVTERHGAFYTDEHLASMSFSSSETSLLYVAERNPPTASEEDPYQKFRYTPQFGEGVAEKRRPTIFLFSWSNGPGEPTRKLTSLSTPSPTLFGQAVFSPHSADLVYATGYEYTPDHRLLGIKFCFNRPSGIWEITLPTRSAASLTDDLPVQCAVRKLTPSHLSCRSPRAFSHGGRSTLVWLSHPTGHAHAATSLVYSLDITSPPDVKSITSPLVDAVFKPEKGAFPGLYPDPNFAPSPILRLATSAAPYLITHSIWGSRSTVVLISIADGAVRDLTPDSEGKLYSWKVLNTDGKSRVVCTRSTPITPHEIVLGQFDETEEVAWRVLHKPVLHSELESELLNLRASIIPIPDRYPTETIVIQSAVAPQTPRDIRPCITTPHGGPHGTTTTAFLPATVALALERYTISLPNYTGSLGFGESAVRALLGNCGTLDVGDCIASTQHLIKLGISVEGPGKQFVMGGSHGGFLAAHLIGQYPDMFSAAVLRNPVISAGEISTSDLPDWYYAEFGIPYPLGSSPSAFEAESQSHKTEGPPPTMTPVIFERLYRASPISHVDAVRAGVLLLVGAADLRVAPTQGIEYYHALKGREAEGKGKGPKRVEMLVFEGESHPLDGVEAARVGSG